MLYFLIMSELKFDLPKRDIERAESTVDKVIDRLKELSIADLAAISNEAQSQMALAETQRMEEDLEKWNDIFDTTENELHFRIETIFGLND